MTTSDEVRHLLSRCRRNPSPGLLEQARAVFREARLLSPDDPSWRAIANYGKNIAAIVEEPNNLNWVATPDGLGLIADIDDVGDYLVVHPQQNWWRAGAAWLDGEQATTWSQERLPSREAAMRAACRLKIPET